MPAPRNSDTGFGRVLGAIVPRENETWYFKMTGPDTSVGAQVEAFEKFLATVRFPEGKPIEWSKPEDWEEKPGREMRFATLLVGPRKLELTVTRFGPLAREGENSLLGNVNRWRRQIGLGPVTAANLEQTTRRIKIAGLDATLIDATRPAPAAEADPHRGNELRYQAPDDWKKIPSDFVSKLKFSLTRDGKTVTVSFSEMSRQDLVANIERWREQMRLPKKFSSDELPKMVSSLELPLGKADYVDISNGGQRLLGIVLSKDPGTWIFKMLGDRDLVESQKTAFETFVKSVKPD
jgi:hypothetical protein